MKTLSLTTVAAVMLCSLAACNHKAETVDSTAPDPMAAQLANAAPVELPPAVTASVSFRCKDNSLAYVDFFHGDKQANLRIKRDADVVHLTAEKAGDPLTGSGYTLSGDQHNITLTKPGEGPLTCKH